MKGGLSLGLSNIVRRQGTLLPKKVVNNKMTKAEAADRGLKILKRTKYSKKIEGHTLFDQDKEMDLWRPPWKIICDGILPPTENDAPPTFENKIFRSILRKKQEEQFLRNRDKFKKVQHLQHKSHTLQANPLNNSLRQYDQNQRKMKDENSPKKDANNVSFIKTAEQTRGSQDGLKDEQSENCFEEEQGHNKGKNENENMPQDSRRKTLRAMSQDESIANETGRRDEFREDKIDSKPVNI